MENICAYHNEKTAIGYCKKCKVHLCEYCVIEINGKKACKKCYQAYLRKKRLEQFAESNSTPATRSIHDYTSSKPVTTSDILKQVEHVKSNFPHQTSSAAASTKSEKIADGEITSSLKIVPRLFKNILAIILSIILGVVLRVIISFIIRIIFKGSEPFDLTILIEIFIAFFIGSLAASLVPSRGAIIGLFSQFLPLSLLVVAGFLYINPIHGLALESWHIRLYIFCIISGTIAGYVTEKYRESIITFQMTIMSLITGSFAVLFWILSFIIEIIPFYFAGKLLFEDGALLKAVVVAFVIGPIASGGISLLLSGIVYGIAALLESIWGWFAKDIIF